MKILLPIDGSAQANVGVDLVARAALPPDTEISVLEAVPSDAGLFAGPWPAIALVQADAVEAAVRQQAEETVTEAAERLRAGGRVVHRHVLPGRPADVILDTAKKLGVDLIVIGSRGHGAIERMLLGSVSGEVVAHATTPVLVARHATVDRVVLAWDGSPGAHRAAATLREWPMFSGASVVVVSVADVPAPWWTGFADASTPEVIAASVETANAIRGRRDELARGMAAQLQTAGFTATIDLREGHAAAEILAAAESADANLIVMGTHARSALARLVIGSVARNVVRHAHCSVLIAPSGKP